MILAQADIISYTEPVEKQSIVLEDAEDDLSAALLFFDDKGVCYLPIVAFFFFTHGIFLPVVSALSHIPASPQTSRWARGGRMVGWHAGGAGWRRDPSHETIRRAQCYDGMYYSRLYLRVIQSKLDLSTQNWLTDVKALQKVLCVLLGRLSKMG
jgi:hypothetical protein